MSQSSLIEPLLSYKDKVNRSFCFDQEFSDLISIEILDFIENNKILSKEFYRRATYLSVCPSNKQIIELQDELFGTISAITKLTDIDSVGKMVNQNRSLTVIFSNDLKCASDKSSKPNINFLELYEYAQDKNNYHRLINDSDLYSFERLIYSRSINLWFIEKQYQQIKNILLKNLQAYLTANPKIKIKLGRLIQKFDRLLEQFNEATRLNPTKLHAQQFERFLLFCKECKQEGFELCLQGRAPEKQEEIKLELEALKKDALLVIDDLILCLKTGDSPLPKTNSPNGSSKKISYEYSACGTPSGKLIIGDSKPIPFTNAPALIVEYFFRLNESGHSAYKNYHDFSEFAGMQRVGSDHFSKAIKAINNHVLKKTKKIITEVIIKGDTKKPEVNIYKWNNQLL